VSINGTAVKINVMMLETLAIWLSVRCVKLWPFGLVYDVKSFGHLV